ncbi:hypothetical protein ASG43_06650 [Aureimonas sp. Leaf454]|uniref:DUF2293 domain-containing protein n=1 Tax=Aureimonas sp. Leaf454 TaxID=1736381 RepID=UPI0006FE732D|nr:DUF2293 domain-containing protein [Aureimonas sp. Leaf454]KQT50922.1 hypothetical protein ASG43_06650 [Aureimonas sp. Leaf454]
MTTKRQQAIAKALTSTIPRVPYFDAEAIRGAAGSRRMRDLPPATALWLAAVAYIRHAHTDYDTLLDDGYGRDAARFFVVDAINDVLDRWGATRRLEPDATDEGDDLASGRIDDDQE